MRRRRGLFFSDSCPIEGRFRGKGCRRVLAASKDNSEDKQSFISAARETQVEEDDEGEGSNEDLDSDDEDI